jgi:hypothetical protein
MADPNAQQMDDMIRAFRIGQVVGRSLCSESLIVLLAVHLPPASSLR